MLGISEHDLRVVAPDVGGGFGAKLSTYGEEALVVALARKLQRPVKWIETRSENMAYTHHGRDQIAYITLGAKSRRHGHRRAGRGSSATSAPTSSS